MDRLIFADIDGVFNSTRSFLARPPLSGESMDDWPILSKDPISVALFNRACEELDLKIVMSTSHRKRFLKPLTTYNADGWMIREQVMLDELRRYMARLGLPTKRIIGATPDINFPGRQRGHEIDYFLEQYGECEYAIIDDGADMLPHQLERFVHTTIEDGITFASYAKLGSLFGLPGGKPHLKVPAG